ncbi:threonylcarbamoyl-AMP synthase [Candidatus Woesearchaeota archaeon]|nr:threonylcarbamoyl-AMP synthase [Candidatus Woesearchaeota archaeon]
MHAVTKDTLDIEALKDSVFIYPTDTIYGIGCDATKEDLVKRVREAKGRETKPFSVIAPSKSWIRGNCEVKNEWLDKLPGPYTLILRLRVQAVAKNVNGNLDTIGVRIPDHWFSKVVSKLGFPVVTTSANRADVPNMTKVTDVDPWLKKVVDLIIDDGPLEGSPSTIIDHTTGKVKER